MFKITNYHTELIKEVNSQYESESDMQAVYLALHLSRKV
jgi:hypothetical protein